MWRQNQRRVYAICIFFIWKGIFLLIYWLVWNALMQSILHVFKTYLDSCFRLYKWINSYIYRYKMTHFCIEIPYTNIPSLCLVAMQKFRMKNHSYFTFCSIWSSYFYIELAVEPQINAYYANEDNFSFTTVDEGFKGEIR